MKKIGKKFSYLTKVLLVFGLLFSNLSSLSVVFAYEAENITAVADTDNKGVNVKYLEEIDDTDEVTITLNENYMYLDDTTETEVVTTCNTTGALLKAEEGVLCESSMLTNVVYDGLYEASATLYNVTDEEELGTVLVESVVNSFDEGMTISVYDAEDNLITPSEDGLYTVTGAIKVHGKINAGGLAPTWTYTYDEVTYTADELLGLDILIDEVDFTGSLYGEYTVDKTVLVLDVYNEEELTFDTDLKLVYGEYADNTLALESLTDDTYEFVGEGVNNQLYVYGAGNTVDELYSIVANFVSTFTNTTYTIGNGEYTDIAKAYEEHVLALGEEAMTFEEFCQEILIDNSTVITLTSNGLTIKYTVMIVGDINNDLAIDEKDLQELIDQTVGVKESNLTKSDLDKDGELTIKDAAYLKEALANSWNISIDEVEAILEGRLDVKDSEITSGDTFTVEYVLSLAEYAVSGISGVITYDDGLELISEEIIAYDEWIGNNKDGKFLYMGDTSLTGTEVVDEDVTTYESEEYVLLTLTFKATSAGDKTIAIANPEFINGNEYLVVSDLEVSTVVTVNESSDNELKLLTVAGQEIILEEGTLGYTITVGNDVLTAEVLATVKNVAAKVTSIVAPEQLEVGENTITIVVTAENGDEKIYTVTVIREAGPEEEETTTTQVSYSNNVVDTDDDEEEVVVKDETDDTDEEEQVEDKEESNLSRIIIIVLILLVIAGLIYLIFKDEDDEDKKETKKVNKDINKIKKEEGFGSSKNEKKAKPKNNTKKGR